MGLLFAIAGSFALAVFLFRILILLFACSFIVGMIAAPTAQRGQRRRQCGQCRKAHERDDLVRVAGLRETGLGACSRIRMPSSRRPAITLSICRLLIPKPSAMLGALIFGLPATRCSTRSVVVTTLLLTLPTLPTLPTSLPTNSLTRDKRIVDRSGFTRSLSTGLPNRRTSRRPRVCTAAARLEVPRLWIYLLGGTNGSQ